jgi:hypothetical protein
LIERDKIFFLVDPGIVKVDVVPLLGWVDIITGRLIDKSQKFGVEEGTNYIPRFVIGDNLEKSVKILVGEQINSKKGGYNVNLPYLRKDFFCV